MICLNYCEQHMQFGEEKLGSGGGLAGAGGEQWDITKLNLKKLAP